MEGVQLKGSSREFSASRYAGHSLGVTVAVIVVPVILAPMLIALVGARPSGWGTAIVATAISLGASTLGSCLWHRLPGTRHIAFAELLPWSYVRLLRAEKRLVEATGRLGLDRRGKRFRQASASVEEQKKILRALNAALEAKDLYTLGHTRRVSRHSYSIAKRMRLPLKDIEKIRVAADVHDVGKTHVPDDILRKPDRLTDDEYAEMKLHSEVGAEIVAGLGDDLIVSVVRAHHERWDGQGYPDGLAGSEIPLGARIIAVADTYDAITTSRSYRAKSSHRKAVRILREEADRQFDPKVVAAFLSHRQHRAAGGTLLLTNILPQQLRLWLASLVQSAASATFIQTAALGGAAVIGAAMFIPHLQPASELVRDGATAGRTNLAQGAFSSGSHEGSGTDGESDIAAREGTGSAAQVGQERGRGVENGPEAGRVGSGVPGTYDDSPADSGDGEDLPATESGDGSGDSSAEPGESDGEDPGPEPTPNPDPDDPLPDLPDVPDVPDIPDVPDVPDIPDVPDVPDIPDLPDVPDLPPLPDLPDLPPLPDLPDLPPLPIVQRS